MLTYWLAAGLLSLVLITAAAYRYGWLDGLALRVTLVLAAWLAIGGAAFAYEPVATSFYGTAEGLRHLVADPMHPGGLVYVADTVAVPSDRIAVLPIYEFAEPYILTAFGVIVSVLLSWALAQLQTRTGIKVSADARERIQTAATNAAGRILAAQEGNIAHMSFPAGSPVIAAQVPKIEAAAADAIKHLGMTPERIGDLIAGKIGQLQAAATVTPPVVSTTQVTDPRA